MGSLLDTAAHMGGQCPRRHQNDVIAAHPPMAAITVRSCAAWRRSGRLVLFVQLILDVDLDQPVGTETSVIERLPTQRLSVGELLPVPRIGSWDLMPVARPGEMPCPNAELLRKV